MKASVRKYEWAKLEKPGKKAKKLSYKAEVLRTINTSLSNEEILVNSALGLCGEAGEYADMVKKHIFHKHDMDKEKAIKELGDIRWYLEAAAFALGTTLEEIEAKNVEKLNKRYPNGFNPSDSINRKE